jgi:hypothetical protein
MNSPKLRLALAAMTLPALVALYSCGGGTKSSSFGTEPNDGATPGDGWTGSSSGAAIVLSSGGAGSGSGGASSTGSGGSGASGSSGAASTSSSGMVFTCGGCIDLNGACNDGGADTRCGLHNSTCQDCTKFGQVCASTGECTNGAANGGG